MPLNLVQHREGPERVGPPDRPRPVGCRTMARGDDGRCAVPGRRAAAIDGRLDADGRRRRARLVGRVRRSTRRNLSAGTALRRAAAARVRRCDWRGVGRVVPRERRAVLDADDRQYRRPVRRQQRPRAPQLRRADGFMLAYLKVPLSWGEILRRTVRECDQGQLPRHGGPARLLLLLRALPRAALPDRASRATFRSRRLIDDMFAMLGGIAPPEALSIITDQIRKISEGEQGGLLTLGMLLALWSTSAAMTAIIDTLNAAYDIEEGPSVVESAAHRDRPDRRRRRCSSCVSFALILVGPTVAQWIADTHAARRRVRLDVDDPAVAARLPAREHGHRHRLLLRARRGAGLGVADAGLHCRRRSSGWPRRSRSSSTSSASGAIPRRTAPSAVSWC